MASSTTTPQGGENPGNLSPDGTTPKVGNPDYMSSGSTKSPEEILVITLLLSGGTSPTGDLVKFRIQMLKISEN